MENKKKPRTKPFSKWSSATSFSAKVNGSIETITSKTGDLTHIVTYYPGESVVEKIEHIFTGEEKL